MRKRRLAEPWPFLYSVVPKRGLVVNLPPPAKKPTRLRKVRPIATAQQVDLLEDAA